MEEVADSSQNIRKEPNIPKDLQETDSLPIGSQVQEKNKEGRNIYTSYVF